jgi:hypothetical protein
MERVDCLQRLSKLSHARPEVGGTVVDFGAVVCVDAQELVKRPHKLWRRRPVTFWKVV